MSIDWSAFTPWSALIGGALIGLVAAMLAMLVGMELFEWFERRGRSS